MARQRRLQLGDARLQRLHDLIDLLLGETRRDVLRAIPVVGVDLDDDSALDLRAIARIDKRGREGRVVREIDRTDAAQHFQARALYKAVADKVAGVCAGCADIFGAREGAEASGLNLIRNRDIPGTSGVIDLSRYLDEGYRLVAF